MGFARGGSNPPLFKTVPIMIYMVGYIFAEFIPQRRESIRLQAVARL
jgi:hypothetical protein